MRFKLAGPAVGLVMCVAGCTADLQPPEGSVQRIDAADLRGHIQTLASDAFAGREPASPGEELTIDYLREAFRDVGLEPGNGDSYLQEVPLVSITARPDADLTVAGDGGEPLRFEYPAETMAWTTRLVESTGIESSEILFVGYGIVAPEYDWNDYEGVDAAGKTVLILVNDPGYATQDTSLFNGNAMTYYGRWTYKYEEAARQGASGAIIIHETGPAGYGWEVVANSWSGPQFHLVPPDSNMGRAAIEGWVTSEAAAELLSRAGYELAELKERALAPDFRAVSLGLTASQSVSNTLSRSTSHNVLGLLRGRERPDEVVIFTAHWDHLGVDPSLEGDTIYNGAVDNATGTAGIIEIADAFAGLPSRPARSILFFANTAEEQGLLGTRYYAQNPVYPLDHTVAVFNIDAMQPVGVTRDITVVGYGKSELDEYIEEAARSQGRIVRPDPEPEKGFYYRSDHFSFARFGVPAAWVDTGVDAVDGGEERVRQQLDEYTSRRYHAPADEYSESWNLEGMVLDLRLLYRAGYRLAESPDFPNWREGTEFRATRDSMMAGD